MIMLTLYHKHHSFLLSKIVLGVYDKHKHHGVLLTPGVLTLVTLSFNIAKMNIIGPKRILTFLKKWRLTNINYSNTHLGANFREPMNKGQRLGDKKPLGAMSVI